MSLLANYKKKAIGSVVQNFSSLKFDRTLSSYGGINTFDVTDLSGSETGVCRAILFELEFMVEVGAALGPTWSTLISRYAGATSNRSFILYVDDSPAGRVQMQLRGGAITNIISSSTGLNDGNFHKCLIHTYVDGAGDTIGRMFIDNAIEATTNLGSGNGIVNATGSIDVATDGTRFANVELRNIKFWDWSNQYSEAQVDSYVATGSGLESDLYATFHMDNYTNNPTDPDLTNGSGLNSMDLYNMPTDPLIIR